MKNHELARGYLFLALCNIPIFSLFTNGHGMVTYLSDVRFLLVCIYHKTVGSNIS